MALVETDYFGLLDDSTDFEGPDLRKAYIKQAKRTYPDGCHDDMFKDTSDTYPVLSDPALREVYDQHKTEMVNEELAWFFANVFGGERFVEYIGEISVTKDLSSVEVVADKLRGQEKSAMEARIKMLTTKMTKRLRQFVEAERPGEKDDPETVAFEEKIKREAEKLKLQSFGLELLRVIGNVYMAEATSFFSSQKFLGTPGFLSRVKEEDVLAMDISDVVDITLSPRRMTAELEKEVEALREAGEEELVALDTDITRKILVASWRDVRSEVIQVLQKVIINVLNDPEASDVVLSSRAKGLFITGAIFRSTIPDASDEVWRDFERLAVEATQLELEHDQAQVQADQAPPLITEAEAGDQADTRTTPSSPNLNVAHQEETPDLTASSPLDVSSTWGLIIDDEDDLALAISLQHAYDYDFQNALEKTGELEREDGRLSAERQVLVKDAKSTFTCGVCLEDHNDDDVARIPTCEHPFCRECLRAHILSRISEYRYPIFCPVCTTEKDRAEPGLVTEDLVEQIWIPEKEYRIFEELQLSAFSILVHCHRCNQSMFLARDEYQEIAVLTCPLPGCGYVWCKACQQPIPLDGPEHSCDGSTELEDLMKREGWKYCPGCKTPIQKDSGCNHMACTSPGCNTHFCYLCGETIIKSAVKTEIDDAQSAHFRGCTIFEEIPDQDVPP